MIPTKWWLLMLAARMLPPIIHQASLSPAKK